MQVTLPNYIMALSITTSLVVIGGSKQVYSMKPEPFPASFPQTIMLAPMYEVTAYSWHCIRPRKGPEPKHRTRAADGSWPIADLTVAADWDLHPAGTGLVIEGLGYRVVTDRGRDIKGKRLDLFVRTCAEARRFGRRWLAVDPSPSSPPPTPPSSLSPPQPSVRN